jgi:hypothetical protein
MTQILEPNTTVSRTWRWCQEAFALHGIKLAFPKNTSPQKTYQWRYATKLAQKIDEWGLDRSTARAFIGFAVEHVKEKKLLHKGLSVFFQNNMMDICYDRMQTCSSDEHNKIQRFHVVHDFVVSRCNNRSTVSVLLGRESFDTFRNIVKWYQAGDITTSYIALSSACVMALSKLIVVAPSERNLLPSDSELYCLAIKLIKDEDFSSQAKAILGNDWRMTLCKR